MDTKNIAQQSTGWSYYLKWGATVLAAVIVVLILLSELVYTKTIVHLVPGVSRLEFLIVFVLAGFFPISAFAYVSFQRKTQLRKLAGDFWLLGIDIRGEQTKEINIPQDLEDLKPAHYSKYFRLLEEQTHVSLNYVIQSILAVLATILGLSLFSWLPRADIFPININTQHALQFGFLGAYIYSVQLIYRRYTTLDLQPTVYLNCTLTLVAGIVFNFVAFEAINSLSSNPATTQALPANSVASAQSFDVNSSTSVDPATAPITPTQAVSGTESAFTQTTTPASASSQAATGLAGGLLAIVAFSLGYFPYLAIRWFNRIGHTTLGEKQRRADALELGLIDGISQFHEVRLRDEGIDNVQNLASAALDELLINTRFSAKQIIEWVDQAVLYLYLEPSEIESFRRGGVRSYSDLEHLWGPLYEVYYVTGDPARKIIETFRRSKITYASLLDAKFQNFSKRILDQWKDDSQPGEGNNDQSQTSAKLLEKTWDEERKNRALQLFQSIPERLDALYLATKLGPNVAHIKNYWRRAEETQSYLQDQFKVLKKVFELFIEIGALRNLDPSGFSFVHHLQHNSYLWYWELKKKEVWDTDETWQDDEEVEIDEEKRKFVPLGKARVAREVGLLERAIDAYNKAIEQEPDRADIRIELAWLYLGAESKLDKPDEEDKQRKKEYLDKALELAEKAVERTEKADLTIELNVDQHVASLKALTTAKERLAKAETDPDEKTKLEQEVKEHRIDIRAKDRSSEGWAEINLQAKNQQDELQTLIDMLKQVTLVMRPKENGQTDLAMPNGASQPIAGGTSAVGTDATGKHHSNGEPAPTAQPEPPPTADGKASAAGAETESQSKLPDDQQVTVEKTPENVAE